MNTTATTPASLNRVLRAAERRADELLTDFFSLASETDPMSIINDHLSKVLGLAATSRSWSEAYNALFPDPTMPPKSWEQNVAGYLFERRYHVESIRLVIEEANAAGSVECCAELAFSDADRATVEGYLPDAPDGEWARHAGTWEMGAGLDLVA